MPTIVLVVIFGLLGGVAVGLQSPLSSMMSQRTGPMESTFIIHLGGALVSGAILAVRGGGSLAQWRSVPWYALGAGVLGLVVIGAVVYTIPRVGVVGQTFLIVAGQLIIAVVIDHFGWFETAVRPIEPVRLLGMALMSVGIWLVVR